MKRKTVFTDGGYYHVCNKSIAHYRIFSQREEQNRFLITLNYYNRLGIKLSLTHALGTERPDIDGLLDLNQKRMVDLYAYCLMPNHFHLLFQCLQSERVAWFLGTIENSYTRYFNSKHKRLGPLWQSRYRCVAVETNEQMLHVSRYIHLNPTSAGLVERPVDWWASSYREYIETDVLLLKRGISINDPVAYRVFVEQQILEQKRLHLAKKLRLE